MCGRLVWSTGGEEQDVWSEAYRTGAGTAANGDERQRFVTQAMKSSWVTVGARDDSAGTVGASGDT